MAFRGFLSTRSLHICKSNHARLLTFLVKQTKVKTYLSYSNMGSIGNNKDNMQQTASVEPGRYVWPAEWAQQSRTLMAYPSIQSADDEEHLKAMQTEIVRIANAIARFEPVHLFTRNDLVEQAKALVDTNVSVKAACADQLWIRDSGPCYVRDTQEDKITAAIFNFNYWGNKLPFTGDEELAQKISKLSNEPSIKSHIVVEGGGLEHDGEGTFLATESCIINDNRNPQKSKQDIEAELSALLGVTHFIWLPGIKDFDITDFHIDAFARFIRPGVVLLSRPDAHAPAAHHHAYEEAKTILAKSKDAHDRSLTVHECLEPDASRLGSPDSANITVASYANYLLVNGAVIMARFGQEDTDVAAFELMKELFPERQVVQVHINQLPRSGGGIHCATQQVPA